jgi:hypothetical protein
MFVKPRIRGLATDFVEYCERKHLDVHPVRVFSGGDAIADVTALAVNEIANALIDEKLPVVVVNTRESGNAGSELRYEKTHSNIVEVKSRDGIIISVLTEGDAMSSKVSNHVIEIPETSDLLGPILSIVPLQLLSYHIAVRRGCDVDQPRNLAKSVTVE